MDGDARLIAEASNTDYRMVSYQRLALPASATSYIDFVESNFLTKPYSECNGILSALLSKDRTFYSNLGQCHCLHSTATIVPRRISRADTLSYLCKGGQNLVTQSSQLAIVWRHATNLFTK